MKRSLLILLLFANVLFSACGKSGSDTTEIWYPYKSPMMSLDGKAGPENVGSQAASQFGYFRDLGVQPKMNAPIEPDRVIENVSLKVVSVGITQEPQVVLAQEEGFSVVLVGSLVSKPTMAMIWLPRTGISGIADLKGKTIAYPGVPFQKDLLEYILGDAGLTLADVKLENVGYELTDVLVSGRADAIFGGSGNEEGAQLETLGFDPVIIKATDLGIPQYDELVLVARPDRYAKEPELFDRILEGSIRGNKEAVEDPLAATEAIVGQSLGTADPRPTRAGVDATAPLLSQTGDVDEEQLEELIDWMHEQGMIDRQIPASDLLAGS